MIIGYVMYYGIELHRKLSLMMALSVARVGISFALFETDFRRENVLSSSTTLWYISTMLVDRITSNKDLSRSIPPLEAHQQQP